MKSEAFSVPQRQSVLGIALIFSTTLFRLLRGFWILGIYFLLSNPAASTVVLVILGILVLAALILGYSWLYFRKFLFHIDYKNEEFVLQKGVFSTQDIAVPFEKIQQVYLKRSLLQRLINVYSVVVETAGSKEDEVNIKALSGEDANKLKDILIQVKTKSGSVFGEEIDQPGIPLGEDTVWTYKLDLFTLFKIGISTNYIRGLALVLAFFATLYNELNSFFSEYQEEFSSYYQEVPDLFNSPGLLFPLLIILFLISVLITVLEIIIKYYGLTLVQTKENLELEMGLKTNTKVALQPRRVQLVQIITNPVQKWLNLYEVRIAVASSENALQKKKIKIPGLSWDTVKKVEQFLHRREEEGLEENFRPHKLMLIRRSVIVFLPVIVSYVVLLRFPYITLNLWFILASLFVVVGITYQFIRFRSLKLIFKNDFLQKEQGVWNKRVEKFELYKMQAVTVKQPIWYKKRKLVNTVYHTAGGDINFNAVSKEIFPFINYLLYKVESSTRKWM